MRTSELGSTGLIVTPVGLGLAALGRPAYINLGRATDLGTERSIVELEQRSHEVLDEAYAAGIRYIDTARSYGRAEQFLASWLRRGNLGPGALTIGSKWGYTYIGGWRLDATVHESKDLSRDTLRRQIVESRSVLGDHLRLFQIHSATLESGVLDDQDVLRELLQLRASGLAIGLTVSGPKQGEVIRRALGVRVDGVNPFQVVQATWNLLETSSGPALAEASARGWGVIIKEAVANGRLTNEHSDQSTTVLRNVSTALGASLDSLAISAALSHRWVDVVLSGAVTASQLRSNLRALDLAVNVDDLPSVNQAPDEYWARRSAHAWA